MARFQRRISEDMRVKVCKVIYKVTDTVLLSDVNVLSLDYYIQNDKKVVVNQHSSKDREISERNRDISV